MLRDESTRTFRLTLGYALVLGVFAAACRLLPYYFDSQSDRLWNLMPMGAVALFVGSRLRGISAYLVPLGAMLVADLLLIGPVAALGYSAFSWGTPLIYASFALYVLIGHLIPRRELLPLSIAGAGLLGSTQFFLITNYLVWQNGTMYPHTWAGLVECYTMAVPFYRNTLLSDVFFAGAFFLVHAVLVRGIAWTKAGQPA